MIRITCRKLNIDYLCFVSNSSMVTSETIMAAPFQNIRRVSESDNKPCLVCIPRIPGGKF